MLIDGKAWGTSEQDLIALGTRFEVNRPRERLEQVIDAVNRWPANAKEAGVAPAKVKETTELQPFSRHQCQVLGTFTLPKPIPPIGKSNWTC
jgi:hypothetical protein